MHLSLSQVVDCGLLTCKGILLFEKQYRAIEISVTCLKC